MSENQDPAQTPRRIGRGMLIVAWAAGLGMLSLLFSNILDQQRNPNTRLDTVQGTDDVLEVRLQRNRYGHYLANGTINSEPVEFMLDTGASDVSIPDAVARRVGLKRGVPKYYETANGTIKAYTTLLDSVGLGGLELQRVRASINPHMDGETILLGMSVLKQLEFTQRGDTMIIRQYQ
ncbi:MAG: TIGR02281 family clan AA aspartic protease [Pseudomonadota bacterium]